MFTSSRIGTRLHGGPCRAQNMRMVESSDDLAMHDDPAQNHLLAALSGAALKRLSKKLEPVDMPLGAVVGNEGVVGVSIFMGGETTPSRAVVQSAGRAFRLPSETMMEEFRRAG